MSGSEGAHVDPVELNHDLVRLLVSAGPDLNGHDALLTPHLVREGATFYTETDSYAEVDAKAAGLDAVFAVPASERRHIGEYSAILLATYGVGVAVTSTVINNICKYIKKRAARDQVTDAPPGFPEGHVRVILSRLHERDGLPGVEAVAIEGRPDDVTESVKSLLKPHVVEPLGQVEELPTVDACTLDAEESGADGA